MKSIIAIIIVAVLGGGWWYTTQKKLVAETQATSAQDDIESGTSTIIIERPAGTIDINEFFARDSQHVYMRVFKNDTRTYPTSTAHYQIVTGADPSTFRLVSTEDSRSLKGEGLENRYRYQDKNTIYVFVNREIMGDVVIRSIERVQ
ncbi:MAG: hypothetical protein WAX57_04165 [Minisyncoccia bacterium]